MQGEEQLPETAQVAAQQGAFVARLLNRESCIWASCSQLSGTGWQVLLKYVPVLIVPIQDRTNLHWLAPSTTFRPKWGSLPFYLYISFCFNSTFQQRSNGQPPSRLRNTTSVLMGLPFCRLQATPSISAMFCPCVATPKQWLGTRRLTSSTITRKYQKISDSWDDLWSINGVLTCTNGIQLGDASNNMACGSVQRWWRWWLISRWPGACSVDMAHSHWMHQCFLCIWRCFCNWCIGPNGNRNCCLMRTSLVSCCLGLFMLLHGFSMDFSMWFSPWIFPTLQLTVADSYPLVIQHSYWKWP